MKTTAPSAILCFIDREAKRAFFTTNSLKDQTGCDWDNAPWEHNADPPEAPNPTLGESHQLFEVWFDRGRLTLSSDWSRDYWTVEQINKLQIPWLVAWLPGQEIEIFAGTTLCDFRRLVEKCDGTVFNPIYHLTLTKEKFAI